MKPKWFNWLQRKKPATELLGEETAIPAPIESDPELDPFLQMVLSTFYGQKTDPNPGRLQVSDEIMEFAIEQYNKMPGKSRRFKKFTLDSPEVKEWFGKGLAMTPGKNVLGRIHKEALALAPQRFSYLSAIPVGLGKDPRLRGRLFYNADGDMAIVLSIGYYYHLYQFNEITFRALQEAGSLGLDAMEEWLYLLISQLSHYIGGQTIPLEPFPSKSGILSRNQTEMDLARLMSNVQQLFVLLHEFGHAVQLRGHGSARGARPEEWHSDLTRDLDADAWAAACFAEGGMRFYAPSMQMRGLFWLFEYYHLIERLENNLETGTARLRFDRIQECIDPHHSHLNPQLRVILQKTFDNYLEEYMTGI
jgi:hypothetical protein